MNGKMILCAALGFAVSVISTAATAHVDVGIGLAIPGPMYDPVQPEYLPPPPPPPPVYAVPPPPNVYAPAPPVMAYGDGDWREREWREHREWREYHWRHQEERERDWHERHGWSGD